MLEGFTTAFQNPSLEKIDSNTSSFVKGKDGINQDIQKARQSNANLAQQTANELDVLRNDKKFLGQNVRTSDGALGYVTQMGVFKPYNSVEDANATIGKNGCPANFLPLNTTPGQLYTDNQMNVTGEAPFPVGTPMMPGQSCGLEGKNVFVNTVASGNKAKYQGCKADNGDLKPFGEKMGQEAPICPAGTFQCGNNRGYCYEPSRNMMASTYRIPEYDAEPGKFESGKSQPHLAADGITYLWPRSYNTYDQKVCGRPKPTVPPCPKGTVNCINGTPGMCYDTKRNQMVSTYIVPGQDKVAQKLNVSYMYLIDGRTFQKLSAQYGDQVGMQLISNNNSNSKRFPLQSWQIDQQFWRDNVYGGRNSVYRQFKAVAYSIASNLNNGQSQTVTVISGGRNSNNSPFKITRKNDTEVYGKLGNGWWNTHTVTYNLNLPKFTTGYLADDGRTRLYKRSDGYDQSCGPKPSVPPKKSYNDIAKLCELAAQKGGYKYFSLSDGQCYIGNKAGNISSDGNCTKDSDDTWYMGNTGHFATYESGAVSRDGLFQKGFITSDNTLKPYGSNLFKLTDRFQSMGNGKVVWADKFINESNTKSLSECEKNCISQFGSNCEGIVYNPSNGGCTSLKTGAMKNGIIMPNRDTKIYKRESILNNDISCPKEFVNIDTAKWNTLPQQGNMTATTKCDLGAITEMAQMENDSRTSAVNAQLFDMEQAIKQDIQSNNNIQLAMQNGVEKLEEDAAKFTKMYNSIVDTKMEPKYWSKRD